MDHLYVRRNGKAGRGLAASRPGSACSVARRACSTRRPSQAAPSRHLVEGFISMAKRGTKVRQNPGSPKHVCNYFTVSGRRQACLLSIIAFGTNFISSDQVTPKCPHRHSPKRVRVSAAASWACPLGASSAARAARVPSGGSRDRPGSSRRPPPVGPGFGRRSGPAALCPLTCAARHL